MKSSLCPPQLKTASIYRNTLNGRLTMLDLAVGS